MEETTIILSETKDVRTILTLESKDQDGDIGFIIEESWNKPYLEDKLINSYITRDHAIQIINHLKKEFEI